MATQRKKQWDAVVAELAAAPDQLAGQEALRLLRQVLESNDGRAIALAAKLIEEHGLSALEPVLADSYRALCEERVHADPDCGAKEAILAALDALEHLDAELFASAARYEQRAKTKGGARDTGARVRARGVLGLARLGHVDALVLFGAALCDPDPNVRLSAARAVAHRGAREGAGLLLLRLGTLDGESELAVECLRGLFVLAPDLAVAQARRLLEGSSFEREVALAALGAAPSDQAVELLEQALPSCTLVEDREQVIQALGLSLRPRAREFLLGLLAGEKTTDALIALRVLALHRYDPRLSARVQAASAHSPELARRAAQLFS